MWKTFLGGVLLLGILFRISTGNHAFSPGESVIIFTIAAGILASGLDDISKNRKDK